MLGDLLCLVRGEDGDRPEQSHASPPPRDRRPDDLGVVLLGDVAAPGLHEPPVVHVLRAPEDLPGAGAELPLVEVGEGRLDDLTDAREVPLANPPNLDHAPLPRLPASGARRLLTLACA